LHLAAHDVPAWLLMLGFVLASPTQKTLGVVDAGR
jgi:hypothetical protein